MFPVLILKEQASMLPPEDIQVPRMAATEGFLMENIQLSLRRHGHNGGSLELEGQSLHVVSDFIQDGAMPGIGPKVVSFCLPITT